MKIYALYSFSCVGPIEVKGNDKTPLHNKHRERLYSAENQRFWVLTGLIRLGIPRQYASGSHDSTLGAASEGILQNVYTIKDKP